MVDKVKLLQAVFSKGRLKNLEKIANQSCDLSKKMKHNEWQFWKLNLVVARAIGLYHPTYFQSYEEIVVRSNQ